MIRAIVYDQDTGEIVKTISCADEDLDLNVTEGQSCILDNSGDEKLDAHIVEKGRLVPKEVEPDLDLLAAQGRARRDQLLKDSDWSRNPERPLSKERDSAWRAYRAALFDITLQPDWPTTVLWPKKPGPETKEATAR